MIPGVGIGHTRAGHKRDVLYNAGLARRRPTLVLLVALAACALSCSLPESRPLPPNSFAFAVFGDGPYRIWETNRFRNVIKDINRADVAWLIHVGDLFWYPCSDGNYRRSVKAINSVQCPVVYTPGDNEWADCYDMIAGSYAPLERLGFLRRTFFPRPGRTLGAHTMGVTTQGENPAWSEFVENVRWVRGGFVFATMHMVGSDNALESYAERAHESDTEVKRRTDAGIAWMEETFALAMADSLSGIVLAMHGDPGVSSEMPTTTGYGAFVHRMEVLVKEFGRPVLLIHGDSHIQRLDKPLLLGPREERLANFTRLETFGSPDIGWVRVVVDSVAGRIVDVEPRRMPRWWM